MRRLAATQPNEGVASAVGTQQNVIKGGLGLGEVSECIKAVAKSGDDARRFGVLMPLTALPGPEGIGTLGRPAERWIEWLVTAGASAPEILVQEVISTLQSRHGATVKHNEGNTENVSFQLPRELR